MPVAFRLALQFLTRFPVRSPAHIGPEELGRSLLYYPLVGLLLGGLLLGAAKLFAPADPLVVAAVVLVIWVAISGGLHLDGLADTADAWVGGRGDRERTLRIMKDPCSGPLGVAAVVLVLLLKFAAIAALLRSASWAPLLLAPMLGRAAVPLLFLSTPYVRRGGLGEAMASHLPRQQAGRVVMLSAVVVLLLVGVSNALLMLGALAGALFLWRAWLLSTLEGTTGDTAGALVEVIEALALLCGVMLGV